MLSYYFCSNNTFIAPAQLEWKPDHTSPLWIILKTAVVRYLCWLCKLLCVRLWKNCFNPWECGCLSSNRFISSMHDHTSSYLVFKWLMSQFRLTSAWLEWIPKTTLALCGHDWTSLTYYTMGFLHCTIISSILILYIYPSIHPFSIRLILHRVAGSPEPFPGNLGHELGDTLDRVPIHFSILNTKTILQYIYIYFILPITGFNSDLQG